jgi:signal transduction histidine kinase
MTTKPKSKELSSIWCVDWRSFEGDFKTIDTVTADLSIMQELNLKEYILNEIDNVKVQDVINQYEFTSGTVLKISNLRDKWDDYFVSQVFDDLEVLAPPKEQGDFKLFLYSNDKPNKYGEILGSICDDYDYKLIAKADKNQNVNIQIFRNEYDVETIKPEFFQGEFAQKSPYRLDDFNKGSWCTNKTFSELLAGFKEVDEENVFEKIGEFEFTFYFMKRTYSTPDLEKFHYNKFNSSNRKEWLNKFGGIKVFRDDFRVRPYGEINNSSFDWLGLGNRQAQSPAGVSKQTGGWRVRPDNVSGAINITRLGNSDFEDKSSREGLQENQTFQILRKIILKIMAIFEEDRSAIAKEMDSFFVDKDGNTKYAEKLAERILEEARKSKEKGSINKLNNNSLDEEKIILSKTIEDKKEEIEGLKDEQKLLRGMASSGIVIASFSHDLSKISQNLTSRIDKVKRIISLSLSENDFIEIEDRKNPFYLLEKMKKQDVKLQNWLHFSIGIARKDKRQRKKLNFKSYLSNLKDEWQTSFNDRAINLLNKVDQSSIRVFEIDMDSIFNNLIINSINAFNLSIINKQREIKIKVVENQKEIIISYYDNGPGLSKDITAHNKIFKPMFTTNVNKYTGDEEGTGLGMWIIESIVKDNDGKVELIYPDNGGFGLRMLFPKKYTKEG